ncbi:MAG: PEP-CTERM sorting domain-containing protein [Planctomycetales bacterium]|nr:PEP-CTERM sorting domain-containing protein [Planctomycetales bacterium]
MRKIQFVLSLTLAACFSCIANAQISTDGKLDDDIVTLVYNPADGNLSIANPYEAAGEAKPVTTLEAVSAGGYFTGTRPPQLTGLFDVFSATKLFKLDPAGFDDLDFGPAMAPGIGKDVLAQDLKVSGSFLGGGSLEVDLMYVPEPSSMVMIGLGLIGLASIRRKRS